MKLKTESLVRVFLLSVCCACIQLHASESNPNSVENLQSLAAQGDAEAQADLGGRYAMGIGVKKDYAEAVRFYRMAAGQDYAEAQYNLGLHYQKGEGVGKDQVEAYAWYHLASRAIVTAAKSRDQLDRTLSPQQLKDAQKRIKELQALIHAGSGSEGAGEARESSPGVIAFSRPLESTDIFMVNEDGSGEHKLATLRNRPSNLSFSPSGKKLAAITSGGDVKTELVVIDVASGKVTELSGSSKSPSRTALNKAELGVCEGRTCWATENVIYFTAAIKGQGVLKPVVAKMDISVPKVEIVVKNAKNPALSADGKKLAYIHLPANWLERPAGAWKLSDPGDLVVKDLAGGATKTIFAHSKNTPADRQNSRGYIFEAAFHPDGKHLMTCCSDEPDSELYYIDMEGAILAVPDMCGTVRETETPQLLPRRPKRGLRLGVLGLLGDAKRQQQTAPTSFFNHSPHGGKV